MAGKKSIYIKDQIQKCNRQILRLEDQLANMPESGILSTTVDNTTVRYSSAELINQLNYWKRKLAKLTGARPMASTIYLGGR